MVVCLVFCVLLLVVLTFTFVNSRQVIGWEALPAFCIWRAASWDSHREM